MAGCNGRAISRTPLVDFPIRAAQYDFNLVLGSEHEEPWARFSLSLNTATSWPVRAEEKLTVGLSSSQVSASTRRSS